MSHMQDHIRAMRAIGDVFADEFASQTDAQLCAMAGMLSMGFRSAAARLEQEERASLLALSEAHKPTLKQGD